FIRMGTGGDLVCYAGAHRGDHFFDHLWRGAIADRCFFEAYPDREERGEDTVPGIVFRSDRWPGGLGFYRDVQGRYYPRCFSYHIQFLASAKECVRTGVKKKIPRRRGGILS